MRILASVIASSLVLAACSAVTAFDDFVGAGSATGTEGGTSPPPTTPGTPPDDDARDAQADADADVTVSPPPCDERTLGPRVGKAASGAGWVNPSGALTSDADAASTALPVDTESNDLVISNFSLDLPTNAVVTHVELRVWRSSDNADIRDESVVIQHGSNTSLNGAKKVEWGLRAPSVYSGLDGSPSGWGIDWDPAIMNAPDFAVRIAAKNHGATTGVAVVDAVEISVRYCVRATSL